MLKDNFLIPVLNPSKTITHLQISVFYEKGGTNVWNGASERRGIYCSVQPIKVDGKIQSFALFSGKKVFLEGSARLNRKRVAAHLEATKTMIEKREGPTWGLVEHICEENKLCLSEDDICGFCKIAPVPFPMPVVILVDWLVDNGREIDADIVAGKFGIVATL